MLPSRALLTDEGCHHDHHLAGITFTSLAGWINTQSLCCCPVLLQCLGLASEVVDVCFKGTASRIGGGGFEQLGRDSMALHQAAYKVLHNLLLLTV